MTNNLCSQRTREKIKQFRKFRKLRRLLLKRDKLNADHSHDTLLNTSTHFQILLIKKRKKVIQITKPSVIFSFD